MSLKYSSIRRFLIASVCALVFLNVYLVYKITDQSSTSDEPTINIEPSSKKEIKTKKQSSNTTILANQVINDYLLHISSLNTYIDSSYKLYLEGLLIKQNIVNASIWDVASEWVNNEHIVPDFAPLLPDLLDALKTRPITRADVTKKGTQLKILLILDNGQPALFKPKWYEPETIIEGTVYSGKDRFHGEVVSFHLARLLKLNRVPVVTWRKLNINTEIFPVVSSNLNQTFSIIGKNTCLYGICYHCKKEDPVCGKGKWIEGSVILWLPSHFVLKKYRHPWQRTYTSKAAMWEVRGDYCHIVRNSKLYKSEGLLLDLIEISIFDFLIGNGDRHHYEIFDDSNSKVLLIDNGKSFGNPNVDHIDILAPLYQCCRLRKSFLSVLVSLKNEVLSKWLNILLKHFKLLPLLADQFYNTLDKRLDKVLAVIAMCLSKNEPQNVLVS